MNTQRLERHHSPLHAVTVLDRSDPDAPRRRIAAGIVSNGRRLRHRISVAAGLCLGLTVLLIAFE